MEVLAQNKLTGKLTTMSEQVFAMNGGESEYDVLDYEGSDTYEDRLKSVTSQTATESRTTEGDFRQRLATASQQARVFAGNSQLVDQGKQRAVVVVTEGEQQHVLQTDPNFVLGVPAGTPNVLESEESQFDGDQFQKSITGGASIKVVSLDQLKTAPTDSITGNTQVIGDGSPQATNAVRMEPETMTTQTPTFNAGQELTPANVTPASTPIEPEKKN